MRSILRKPASAWTLNDVNQVVEQGWEEGVTLEFKQSLPLNSGAQGWAARGTLHESERTGLAKEIVAFANARGGVLLLGVEETPDNSHRAKAIKPVSNVAALVEPLWRSLSDGIDPPLRSLDLKAISTDGTSGVIVITVGESVAAPHGFGKPATAYIRKGTSAVPMTMSELQSNFWTARTRREWIDTIRQEEDREFETLKTGNELFRLRISAIPHCPVKIHNILVHFQNTSRPHVTRICRFGEFEHKRELKHMGNRIIVKDCDQSADMDCYIVSDYGSISLFINFTPGSADINDEILVNHFACACRNFVNAILFIEDNCDQTTGLYSIDARLCARTGTAVSQITQNGDSSGYGNILRDDVKIWPVDTITSNRDILEDTIFCIGGKLLGLPDWQNLKRI